MSGFKDLTGMSFGRLTVIERAEDYIYENGRKERRWLCKCSCENQTVITVLEYNLKRNTRATNSCGCLLKEKTKERKRQNVYDLQSKEYGIGYASNTNKEFWFDKEDYDLIKNYLWSEDNKGYIRSEVQENNKRKKLSLHRLVMNANDGVLVDHIKHNKFDNRKSQLRYVTNMQNIMNSKTPSTNTSGAKGITWCKDRNKWQAKITINGNRMHLGYFDAFEDAVKARKDAEEKYFGEYSYENSMKLVI